MATGEVHTVRVAGIAAGGAGAGRIGGKSVFIEGVAAGETVCCRVTTEHRSWAVAELLDIVEASPDRVRPACALYGICGGCTMQHISYDAAFAAKAAIVQDAFIRIGGFVPPEPAMFPSVPWEYRNRMQFHLKAPFAAFGLKARKSGEIVPIPDCPVADPGIRLVLQKAAAGEPVLSPPPDRDRCTVYARNGLLLSEGGTRRGRTRLLDRDIALDAGVFFQSNGAMLERLIGDLLAVAGSGGACRMADIYCGVGIFAAFLSGPFSGVDLVEENKTALALARENVRHDRAEFFALRDTEWVHRNGRKSGAYGFIVVDPPRQGLSPAVARWLSENGPPLLAYVSCDAATLARDGKILTAGGYDLAELRLYDFYPQTAHIESLAVFRK
jgi:23S rRNA (uracil1939-C5)-methyltransferase